MLVKKRVKIFITLLSVIGYASLLEATLPSATGDYIGVTDINKTAVRINFLDNSDNEDGFIVYGEDIYLLVPKNDETKHIYQYANITGLTCDKTYKVQTVAYNTDGNSTPSDSRDFNIQSTFEVPCEENKAPTILFNNYYSEYIWGSGQNISIQADDSDGDIVSCEWNFHGSDIKHSCNGMWGNNNYDIVGFGFYEPKEYDVTFTVTDNDGATTSDTMYINVIPSTELFACMSHTHDNKTVKVGQGIYIPANIHRGGCDYASYYWTAGDYNNGNFQDLSDFAYYIFPGHKNATALYTPTNIGNQTVTLIGEGSGIYGCGKNYDSININVVEPDYTKDENKNIVIDNITNLMWQEKNSIKKPWAIDPHMGSITTGDTAKTYCENLSWGEYSDWRVPTMSELLSYISPNDEVYWGVDDLSNMSFAISSNILREPYDSELLVKCVR